MKELTRPTPSRWCPATALASQGHVLPTSERRSLFKRPLPTLCEGLLAAALMAVLALGAPAASAHAQVEEIFDPELAGEDGGAGPSSDGAVDIIEDPELAGEPVVTSTPLALPSEVRAIFHTRVGADLVVENAREEIWESQSLLQLEAKLRTDEDTRFNLGLRMRYWATSLERSTDDAGAMRYALDLVPVAANLDKTLGAGVHLRVGYQSVQLGRFDALSSTDVLTIADLRDGPTTLPDASRVGQLAARLDADLSTSIGLQFIWVPFFSPHILQVGEGDYSLQGVQNAVSGANRAALDQEFQQIFGTGGADDTSVLNTARDRITRSARARLASTGLDIFAPDPNLLSSQGAIRAMTHGAAGELAFTAATALEKVPSLELTPIPATQDGDPLSYDVAVQYPRFYLLGLDGATDIGPVQVGAELTLGFRRSFYYEDTLGQLVRFRGQLLQGGLRAEYLEGTDFVLALEASLGAAVSVPDSAPDGFIGLHGGRYQFGVVGLVRYAPSDLGAELAAALVTGTTYYILPRVFYDLGSGVEVEVGAHLFGAIAYTLGEDRDGNDRPSFGNLYDPIDQVFLGLRWVPVL